ncbi:hypothetical protein BDN70DRAFT_934153 [Pholiota conissans]|uniref:CN hydrolase domain-containing protein n=1 Tax=Pholiota conissans TaxID=109636 RepID=A0A9P5YZS6_9AGAR|nr:hypothetical protein BDN70DRAFT_934153 [Pholiota conissans]
MILLLSTLTTYAPILFRRDTDAQWAKVILLGIILASGSSAYRLGASLQALSTPGGSIASLFGISLGLSSLSLASIFIAAKGSLRFASPWSRVTLFPAIWATLWCIVSHINPVGYLATWSIAKNTDVYNWITPYVGPAGKDWVVAAWAIVVSETLTQWFMEPQDGEYGPLLSSAPRILCNSKSTKILGILLTILFVPSIIQPNLPPLVSNIDTRTPLSVGCVLPSYQTYKKHVLSFDDYFTETKKLASMARVILWPEGAVTFNSVQERDHAFASIRTNLQHKIYIGVSFEETVSDPVDPTGRTSMTRTGLAVISAASSTPHLVYYKRHLVPGGESFRLRHSGNEPTLFEGELPRPNPVPKPDWGNAPNFTRPILMTSSICLDFAIPSPFAALDRKPGLILAPARTWDRTVGHAMWLQAKQRAAELNTMILWCDGGEGGVSGVAGGGIEEVTQVGSGSFVRNIAIPHPFNSERTVYARFGSLGLIFFWILIYVGAPQQSLATAFHYMQVTTRRRQSMAAVAQYRGGGTQVIEGPSVTEGDLLGIDQ